MVKNRLKNLSNKLNLKASFTEFKKQRMMKRSIEFPYQTQMAK